MQQPQPIAIDVEDPRELFQMRRRALAFAIRCKHEDGCRRRGSAPRSLITCVHPKPSGLGAAATGIEHRRVVGKQMIRCKDIRAEHCVQRVEPPACAANPSGQRRPIETAMRPTNIVSTVTCFNPSRIANRTPGRTRRQRPVAASMSAVMSKSSFRFIACIGARTLEFSIGACQRLSSRHAACSDRVPPFRSFR